jgi:hypothetical protein
MIFKVSLIFLLSFLSGCYIEPDTKLLPEAIDLKYKGVGKLFGEDVVLFSSNSENTGINKELWQGALKTFNDTPLLVVNMEEGAIETEWLQTSGNNAERFQVKIKVYPSDKIDLQSLRVNVFHQIYKNKKWEAYGRSKNLENSIKGAILKNVRVLRMSSKKQQRGQ